MSISEVFIRRPVMTTLVMAGVMLFGVMAYRLLSVSDLPNVDFPTIQVSATLPGASPETMASSVATPLEKEFSTIAGIDSMTSTSSIGTSNVTLQFNLSRNLDAAAQDVQAAIARANRNLPQNMPYPPSYQKVNPADQPILYVALTSPAIPIYQLDEYGETLLAQRISTVSGVAQVFVYGAQKYAVRIKLDPNQLATRGIGIDQVETAVQTDNVNLPTGTLWGPHTAYTVQANGQLMKAAEYRRIIVMYRNGNPVRLDQLGRVVDGVENDKTAAWLVDQRAVVLAIQRQPGTNTVEVSQAVQKLLPTFRAQLPASVSMLVLYDRAASIHDSVNDVKFTLAFTLALVVMVIFLFLRNVSATVIPSLSMPLSILGTFAAMYFLGYSLDNLSLMAIVLSLGFVVDDAIVMLENIVRHMELGEAPFAAALAGAKEIGFTIVSMTLSLAAVFIPVLFMGGVIGRLFHEFAVTIGVAVLVSGAVSLTLTPMMSSRFLRPPSEKGHGALFQFFERFFDGMLHLYDRGLQWSLRHQATVLTTSVAITAATIGLFMIVPKGFIPSEDTGQIFGFTEAAESVSFDEMVRHQQALAEIVKADPNVSAFMSSAGGRPGFGNNVGVIFMHLKPRAERKLSADEIVAELRGKLAQVPGIRVYLQNPPPIRIGGQLTKSQYQFALQGPDTAELYRVAPLLEAKLRAIPGLVDVTSDLQIKNPEINVEIDRDKAAVLGITPAAVEDALYSAYGARQISTIYTPTNQYRVLMEVEQPHQVDPGNLSELYVHASSGDLVPLAAVARFVHGLGPLLVNHLGQLPAVTLSFNLRPGISLGDAVAAVGAAERGLVPATISTSFQGTAQAFQSSLSGLGLLLLMAIVVIYIVLGILYESFIHPITILSALPLAGFGALATLLLFHVDLTIYAFVGIIMLVGLVKKNGIIMIDFALEAQRKEGKSPADAIYEACLVRFRPIMMTSMAAFLGVLPIALGIGAGAESRQPLGLAVVGGIVFSQLLTLVVTPVVYLYMDRLQTMLAHGLPFRRGRAAAEPQPAAAWASAQGEPN
ncbi:MAG: efflux RND transporter permease subunit [Thermoanaerobaculales bacterium]